MLPHWLIAVLIGQAIICGSYCSIVAEDKGRDATAWLFGGLLFGVIALIAVAGIPITPEKVFEREKQIKALSKGEKPTTVVMETVERERLGKIYSSESYKYLINFARYKENYDEKELTKLKKLLDLKGLQLSTGEIAFLVEYEVFKKKVTSNMPRTLRKYCENFIKSYADEYLNYKEFFVDLLTENHMNFNFNQREMDEMLKQTKEEIEMADFEADLASKNTTKKGE